MNERLKDLYGQAVEYAFSLCGVPGKVQPLQDTINEKFAELIIDDCLRVITEEVSMKYSTIENSEEFKDGVYAGSIYSRTHIKKHFGIGHFRKTEHAHDS